MLIHATKRWPQATTANLWPYAVRMANIVINETPNLQDKAKRTPQQVFSSTTTNVNAKHWKPFGCPVYVLHNALQKGQSQHKWKQRSRVGIYLGPSPQHARNVALVLDRNSGLVSPQFHVEFDPSFHTMQEDKSKPVWSARGSSRKHLPKRQHREITNERATTKVLQEGQVHEEGRHDRQPRKSRDLWRTIQTTIS